MHILIEFCLIGWKDLFFQKSWEDVPLEEQLLSKASKTQTRFDWIESLNEGLRTP